MKTRARPFRPGFTLVEMMAAIVIIGAVGATSSAIIYTAIRNYTGASLGAQLQSEASVTLDRILREMRMIGDDPSVAGVQPVIASLSPSSIVWGSGSAIVLQAGSLMLTESGGAARTLCDDVSVFSIEAFNESNTPLAASMSGAACHPIRRISISLTLTRGGTAVMVRTRVHLRGTMEGV